MPDKKEVRYVVRFHETGWSVGLEYKNKHNIDEEYVIKKNFRSFEEAYAYADGHGDRLFGHSPVIRITVKYSYINTPRANKRRKEGRRDADTSLEEFRELLAKF
ncbi:MAG: hypothetical protein HY445_00590 [Candidatus Niyogibacteria bacterium]|nr:hypothetical protein [Candidatus Niyogibacteria bacterium]